MPKICYIHKQFSRAKLAVIATIDRLIADYAADGFDLTSRQIYYRFVGEKLFPPGRRWKQRGRRWVKDPAGTTNAPPNYAWIKGIINEGRLAGLLDWHSVVDRTRELREHSHWESPADIVETCARQYRIDTRSTQSRYVEVWVEKDALIEVVGSVCRPADVPFFSSRGYNSQSAMWRAATRLLSRGPNVGRPVVLLHLADHDPSGVDMTRDIEDRLTIFCPNMGAEVQRVALTLAQIEQYDLVPDPTKPTDSRSAGYRERFGDDAWELDAIDPRTLAGILTAHLATVTEADRQANRVDWQERGRSDLTWASENWSMIEEVKVEGESE